MSTNMNTFAVNLKIAGMKRINEYKKLFKVEGPIDLKELKTSYRGLVKEWHPDKFQNEEEKEEAGEVSQKIIDGFFGKYSSGNQRIKFRRISSHNQPVTGGRFLS